MVESSLLQTSEYGRVVRGFNIGTDIKTPSLFPRKSVGLTILSTDSITFLLPLTYYYGLKDMVFLAFLLLIILFPYGLLRISKSSRPHA